jgi:hypothetical protein
MSNYETIRIEIDTYRCNHNLDTVRSSAINHPWESRDLSIPAKDALQEFGYERTPFGYVRHHGSGSLDILMKSPTKLYSATLNWFFNITDSTGLERMLGAREGTLQSIGDYIMYNKRLIRELLSDDMRFKQTLIINVVADNIILLAEEAVITHFDLPSITYSVTPVLFGTIFVAIAHIVWRLLVDDNLEFENYVKDRCEHRVFMGLPKNIDALSAALYIPQ